MLSYASLGAVLAGILSFTTAVPLDTEDFMNATSKHIISLKPGADLTSHVKFVRDTHEAAFSKREGGEQYSGLSHQYSIGDFAAYAGHFHPSFLEQLGNHPDVADIQADQIYTIRGWLSGPSRKKKKAPKTGSTKRSCFSKKPKTGMIKQFPAEYGLNLISNNGKCIDQTYWYDASAGANTFGYVIDSGINIHHNEFGKRATWGYNAVKGSPDKDLDGHGTHIAGTMAGKKYGVAKNANLIAVKVYAQHSVSSVMIDGLQWTVNDIVSKHRQAKAVVNISVGGRTDKALNAAVTAAVAKGITVVVAAGNDAQDAKFESPASAEGAIAVAGSDQSWSRAKWSNFGPDVAIFAPGVSILSAYKGGNSATAELTGTSSAAPFVSGLVLYFKALYNLPDAKTTRQKLVDTAHKGLVRNPGPKTPDLFANNGSQN